MKEDKYIEELVGKRNPFVVPEGYFEQLTDQVMQSLPERRPRAKSVWMRPVFYAAASVCAVIFGAGLLYSNHFAEPAPVYSAAKATAVESNIDQAADYVMIDNEDIYSYLADY